MARSRARVRTAARSERMPLPHNRCQPRTGQPVYNWLRALHWWLFPGHCVLCDLGSGRDFDLCASCEADLPWIQVACPRCAVPLPTPAPACAGCLRRPPSFACTRAPMAYQGVVASLVPLWKKGELPALQRVLVGLLAARVAPGAANVDLLLPVPLHRRRRAQRGFNQAQELALGLGAELGLPVLMRPVVRTRDTRSQQGLSAAARRRNLRGAFRIEADLSERHVAVVDDVVTTGATAEALAVAALRAGAERVEVWAVARTPRPRG